MKTSNKILSLASIAAMLTSISAMPVSAAQLNAYSVSYETLTEAIETTEGDTIPAGAVAVTMSVDNNTGFNANTLTLDIANGYTVITNDENNPIVQKDKVLAEANIAGAVSQDGTTLCVAVGSGVQCEADGQMFTVYFDKNHHADSDFVSVQNTEFSISSGDIITTSGAGLYAQYGYYYVGDTDNNGIVNSSDAADIYTAVRNRGDSFCIDEDFFDFNREVYFVNSYFPNAECYLAPDATENLFIDNADGDAILVYSANTGAGNSDNSHIGERVRYQKS